MSWRPLVAMAALVGVARIASGACGDGSGNAAAITAARVAVAAACDCATVADHRAYRACARGVATNLVTVGQLPKICLRTVLRCAAQSRCGRPGAVTCCRTSANGTTRCRMKASALECRAPKRGSACVGVLASCCDACGTRGCDVPTTSTTTTSSTTTTTTTMTTPRSCGSFVPSPPFCGGSCQAGETCVPEVGPGASCVCVPAGFNPCLLGVYPGCGGQCSQPGAVCQAVDGRDGGVVLFQGCMCVPTTGTCGSTGFSCGLGPCPGGICFGDQAGPSCGCSP
ncbi:MAG: hypothetical protein ACREQL_05350 [Candidatus Binatia bacterium]